MVIVGLGKITVYGFGNEDRDESTRDSRSTSVSEDMVGDQVGMNHCLSVRHLRASLYPSCLMEGAALKIINFMYITFVLLPGW
jgi:hypothetical protein